MKFLPAVKYCYVKLHAEEKDDEFQFEASTPEFSVVEVIMNGAEEDQTNVKPGDLLVVYTHMIKRIKVKQEEFLIVDHTAVVGGLYNEFSYSDTKEAVKEILKNTLVSEDELADHKTAYELFFGYSPPQVPDCKELTEDEMTELFERIKNNPFLDKDGLLQAIKKQ